MLSVVFYLINFVIPLVFLVILLTLFLFKQKIYRDLKVFTLIFLGVILVLEFFFQYIFVYFYGIFFFSEGFIFIFDSYC